MCELIQNIYKIVKMYNLSFFFSLYYYSITYEFKLIYKFRNRFLNQKLAIHFDDDIYSYENKKKQNKKPNLSKLFILSNFHEHITLFDFVLDVILFYI